MRKVLKIWIREQKIILPTFKTSSWCLKTPKNINHKRIQIWSKSLEHRSHKVVSNIYQKLSSKSTRRWIRLIWCMVSPITMLFLTTISLLWLKKTTRDKLIRNKETTALVDSFQKKASFTKVSLPFTKTLAQSMVTEESLSKAKLKRNLKLRNNRDLRLNVQARPDVSLHLMALSLPYMKEET